MRFSTYSILSDPLPGGGFVLLNGLSGALDLISTELGNALKGPLSNGRNPEDGLAMNLLSQATEMLFLKRGHLTRATSEQEQKLVVNLAEALHEQEAETPKFMIVPNFDCNYRCTYCFERPLQNKLKSAASPINHSAKNVVMSPEQVGGVYVAIDRMLRKANLRPGGLIILYGGEPLDKKNKELVRLIVKEGKNRKHHFATITNGHNIDEFVDLFGSGQIEQVQVSIDGPKEVHDKRRVFVGKESSFDKILGNIDLLLQYTDTQVQIRVHIDPENLRHLEELTNTFEARGWLDHPQIVIYGNTVYEKINNGEVTVRLSNREIEKSIFSFAAGISNFFTGPPSIHAARALDPIFAQGKRFPLKGTYCSANTGNYIFAPDGNVYACWESVGKDCSQIGKFDETGQFELNESSAGRWFTRSVAKIPECQKCAYALVCGGGCAQYAEYNSGSPLKPYCDDFQSSFRTALTQHAEAFLSQSEAHSVAVSNIKPTNATQHQEI